MNGRVLFLIPARGGSRGILGKNLRAVGAISLVGRAIRTARRAARVLGREHRVVVSTDDSDIAREARYWGASVPFMRPPELATDTASSLAVAAHAASMVSPRPDIVVLLQPTSPLTEVADVLDAIARHETSRGAPVVSVVQSAHPIAWTFTLGATLPLLTAAAAGTRPHRRQDATPTYRPSGNIYVASAEHLAAGRGWLVDGLTQATVVPAERAIDVDTELDLLHAEMLLSRREPAAIYLNKRRVGPGAPCLIIAEAGVNHNGSLERAKRLIDVAAAAGADAVKFQSFVAEKLVRADAEKVAYQKKNTTSDPSQLAMLKRLELDEAAHHALIQTARDCGVMFLSTPFDEHSADLLVELGVSALKVPSGEITNTPFLRHIASKALPVILSTGMADLREVLTADDVLGPSTACALLQCTTSYPTLPADVNLRAMDTLAAATGRVVGLSDHSMGLAVAFAAAARGASVLEKHFTLERSLPGPDHAMSLEPEELRDLARGVREIEAAMGDGQKQPRPVEAQARRLVRRSLVLRVDLPAGTTLRADHLTTKRPADGLAPDLLDAVIGREVTRDVFANQPLLASDVLPAIVHQPIDEA